MVWEAYFIVIIIFFLTEISVITLNHPVVYSAKGLIDFPSPTVLNGVGGGGLTVTSG